MFVSYTLFLFKSVGVFSPVSIIRLGTLRAAGRVGRSSVKCSTHREGGVERPPVSIVGQGVSGDESYFPKLCHQSFHCDFLSGPNDISLF